MKNKTLIAFVVGFLVNLCVLSLFAQEEQEKSLLFSVREVEAKPSMNGKYEEAVKGLVAKLKEHEVTSVSFLCAASDNFRYSYVVARENMAALDDVFFKELQDKMGNEQMTAMWEHFDGTTESTRDFMLRLRPDLSYKPEVDNIGSEETPFRHFDYLYFQSGKGEEAMEILKEWTALCQLKNVPMAYRTYIGGLGTEVPSVVWVEWAKDEVEYYTQRQKNSELLGEEADALWQKTLAITKRFEHNNGSMRLDLSYVPAEKITAKE